MKLKVQEKYAFIFKDGVQVQYFENFQGKDSVQRVLEVSVGSKEGQRFFKEHDQLVLDMEVYWFGKKMKYKKAMFIAPARNEVSFCHIILMK